jgi:Domain of unknown function (DUF4398)
VKKIRFRRRLLFIPCLALAACATPDPPESEMAAARAMVAQAQPAGEVAAPAELRNAQDKLARAEIAMQRGQHEDARRLALEAEADAKLAWATAQNSRVQRALQQERTAR